MKTYLLTTAGLAAFVSLALGSATVMAAEPVTAEATEEPTEVIIYGQGQSRQVQTLRGGELLLEAPGTSPLKAIDKLPGVSFQSADPFGAYEWSTRITIRGFNQNQLGFTLDGMPLGDMSYGNHNGLHISRAIINEDVGRVDLTQGAGALSTASTSNLGGTLQFSSRDVSTLMGGEAALTLGSDSMHRFYGRFDTGSLDNLGGLRAYVSVAEQATDKWKGGGQQKLVQYNAKAVLPLFGGELTGFFNRSERREQDYQDMSFEMIDRLGRDWDNFQPNWRLANDTAFAYLTSTPLPTGIGTVDDAYYYGAGVRDDNLFSLGYKKDLSDTLRISGTVYKHTNEGQGLWVTPYLPSPGNPLLALAESPFYDPTSPYDANVSIRTTEYDVDRTGAFGAVELDLGAHSLSAGLWYETNDFGQARRFYGERLAAPTRDSLGFQSDPFYTQWEYAFTTTTTVAYVQDVWTISDVFKINYGFKAMKVENEVETIVGNPLSGQIESEDGFLPQVGFVFRMGPSVELFSSYSENMAAYVAAATSGPFSSLNQDNVDFVSANLKPETSKTLEGGFRLNFADFRGVVALYHVEFDDRILAIQQGSAIQGNAPVLSNVGGVKTNGIELAGTWRLSDRVKLYSSYSLNNSKYTEDYVSNGETFRTEGKAVINTPRHMFNAEVSYDDGSLFSTLGLKYTGERYYTYENIGGKVDGFTVMDYTLGYRFAADLDLQLNVTNLTDQDYISTVGSGGFVNRDPNGTAQTLLPAAPRQVFVSLRKRF